MADTIDPRDRHRVVRALELHEAGELVPPDGPNRLWTDEVRHPTLLVGLTMDREALKGAIDARVDSMVAGGAATRSPARTPRARRRPRARRSGSTSCWPATSRG